MVYLESGRTATKLPPVPVRRALVQLDSRRYRFGQHVVLLQFGDALGVNHRDTIRHNLHFLFYSKDGSQSGDSSGGQTEFEIEAIEPAPIPVACNIHPWIKARLLAPPSNSRCERLNTTAGGCLPGCRWAHN